MNVLLNLQEVWLARWLIFDLNTYEIINKAVCFDWRGSLVLPEPSLGDLCQLAVMKASPVRR